MQTLFSRENTKFSNSRLHFKSATKKYNYELIEKLFQLTNHVIQHTVSLIQTSVLRIFVFF